MLSEHYQLDSFEDKAIIIHQCNVLPEAFCKRRTRELSEQHEASLRLMNPDSIVDIAERRIQKERYRLEKIAVQQKMNQHKLEPIPEGCICDKSLPKKEIIIPYKNVAKIHLDYEGFAEIYPISQPEIRLKLSSEEFVQLRTAILTI